MRVRNAANDAFVASGVQRVWDGSAWVDACVRVWDGTAWQDISSEVVAEGGTVEASYVAGAGPFGSTTANYVLSSTSESGRQDDPTGSTLLFTRPWRTATACSAGGDFEAALLSVTGPDAGAVTGPGVGVWSALSGILTWALNSTIPERSATLQIGFRRAGGPTIATVTVPLIARYEI